jgi:hypothetical protein
MFMAHEPQIPSRQLSKFQIMERERETEIELLKEGKAESRKEKRDG